MTVIGTGISWTDSSWNPWVGCIAVSAGCDHCYARDLVDGGYTKARFGHPFNEVKLHLNRLSQIGKFKPIVEADGRLRPHLVFVNSMSDFFFEQVPDSAIHQALDAMETAPNVVFQILSKRPVRARQIIVARYGNRGVPKHIWFGFSAEDNRVAARVRILRTIKERVGDMVTFLSVEPIVGPTDELDFTGIDWSILGGESGPKARIMETPWLLAGLENASKSGAAIWLKQHGQIRSNPLLHHAPAKLGIMAKFQWLIDNGLEILGQEKGGATLEGRVTFRELPPQYQEIKAQLNRGELI